MDFALTLKKHKIYISHICVSFEKIVEVCAWNINDIKDTQHTMESEKKQTLAWMEKLPRSKLNAKNMVMVIKEGKVSFVPKHLLLSV